MDVPKVAVAQPVAVKKPIESQASFALGKVVSSIRRGTVVAHFPRRPLGLCNRSHPRNSTHEWGRGRYLGDWRTDVGDIFFEVLRDRGLNVVGDPADLFDQGQAVHSAEYKLGARIIELKGNFCEKHQWSTGWPTGRYSGEFFIRVEWSVYSNLLKRTVARIETRGQFKQKRAIREGLIAAFLGAFGVAAENLLAEKEFIRVLEDKPAVRKASVSGSTPSIGTAEERLTFPKVKERRRHINRIVGDVQAAAVTVRVGGGHGSGFVISRSGLVLTNEHVVKDSKRVRVIFTNGVEVTGNVLRRSRARDVALVQVPIRVRSVTPIRVKPADLLEEVYAVGSPFDEGLAASITKGIVSAWRDEPKSDRTFIQADVPISGGNSGGALLDRFGNAVGIAVASYVGARNQNLNLFIPIHDALEALNISYEQTRTSSRR